MILQVATMAFSISVLKGLFDSQRLALIRRRSVEREKAMRERADPTTVPLPRQGSEPTPAEHSSTIESSKQQQIQTSPPSDGPPPPTPKTDSAPTSSPTPMRVEIGGPIRSTKEMLMKNYRIYTRLVIFIFIYLVVFWIGESFNIYAYNSESRWVAQSTEWITCLLVLQKSGEVASCTRPDFMPPGYYHLLVVILSSYGLIIALVYIEKGDIRVWRNRCCKKKQKVTVNSANSHSGGSGKKKKGANANVNVSTSPVTPLPPTPKPKPREV